MLSKDEQTLMEALTLTAATDKSEKMWNSDRRMQYLYSNKQSILLKR